jgi:lipopolysaccharide transport system permease protein
MTEDVTLTVEGRRSRIARVLSPAALLRTLPASLRLLRRHRHLAAALTRREITDPHERELLGPAWAFIQPLMLMTVFALVFAYVFKLRIAETAGQLPLDYTTYLLCGLVPWLGFLTCMTRSTTTVLQEETLVRQVHFPIELLAIRTAAAALIIQLVGMLYVVTYAIISLGRIPSTYALVPVLLLTQFVAMAGAAFIISSISVFFRDLRDIIQMAALIGVYLLPIFYLPDAVPDAFRSVLRLNPFSYMVWCYQDAIYYGRIAHWYAWVIFMCGSLFVYALGYRLFAHLKTYFGDVL